MSLRTLKNNDELLSLLKGATLKSKSCLNPLKDLDLIISTNKRKFFEELMIKYKGRCYFKWGKNIGESKFILPLKEYPYFRLVHISVGGLFKRGFLLVSLRDLESTKEFDKDSGFFFIRNIKFNHRFNIKYFPLFCFKLMLNLLKYWQGGTTIVFLGVDGSGKTTITEKLAQLLSNFFNVNRHYFGWKEFVLPVFSWRKKRSSKNSNQKRKEKTGWIYLIAFYIELWLRFLIRVVPNLLLGRIIIFDRYFYDKLVHIKKDSLKYKLLEVVTPKPSFVFLLRVRVSTILKRKKEKDYETLSQLQEKYEMYAKKKGFIIIDNDSNLRNVIKNIVEILQTALIKKKKSLE